MTGAIADKSFATSLTPLWLVTFSLELELRLELKNADPSRRPGPLQKTLVDGLASAFAYC